MVKDYHYAEYICDRCGTVIKLNLGDRAYFESLPDNWIYAHPIIEDTESRQLNYILCPVCARIVDKLVHNEMKYYKGTEDNE